MKTIKIITILALVATFSLATISPAYAHHHRRHHGNHGGDIAVAAVGGTMLGLVMGSVISQPQQAPQPQVVVVQQPTSNTSTSAEQYQALSLERERARNDALEREIALIRAQSSQ